MIEGIILKGYSGFYYVKNEDNIYECSLRGKNKLKKKRFLPGDKVVFEKIAEGKGVIEKVFDRKNQLIRPPIANVDQVIIVNACSNPKPDFWLIDRLTILALFNKVKPVICFNKCDLITDSEQEQLKDIYLKAGFTVLFCSAKMGIGVKELKDILKDKQSVFAGLSGVGKSSLLNTLLPEKNLQTGEISEKLKRGKHTTRHVEFLVSDFGALVADTPGFSSLDLPSELTREELAKLFPDIHKYREECKFSPCLHNKEPICGVKEAVKQGLINENRYNNYLAFLEEVIAKERSF